MKKLKKYKPSWQHFAIGKWNRLLTPKEQIETTICGKTARRISATFNIDYVSCPICIEKIIEKLQIKKEQKMNNIQWLDECPFDVVYKNRNPDPGPCKVLAIDWEKKQLVITNGIIRLFPTFDRVNFIKK